MSCCVCYPHPPPPCGDWDGIKGHLSCILSSPSELSDFISSASVSGHAWCPRHLIFPILSLAFRSHQLAGPHSAAMTHADIIHAVADPIGKKVVGHPGKTLTMTCSPFPFLYFLPLYFDTGFPVVQASLKLIMYNWRWLWVLLPLLFLGGKQSCLFYFCIIFFTQAQRLGKRWFNRKGNCSSFQVFTCICTMCACACIYMVPVCNQVNECACRDQRLMSDVFLYHCPLYLLRWRLTESGTHGSTNLK